MSELSEKVDSLCAFLKLPSKQNSSGMAKAWPLEGNITE